MELYDIVALTVVGILSVTGCGAIWKMRQLNKELRRLDGLLIRNEEVFNFRMDVLHKYGCDALESMPPYDMMVEDDRPLTMQNYVNPDKLVNLN